jgi:cytochrome c oxidase assembly protein subunit 15
VAYLVAIAAFALWLRGKRAKLEGAARGSGDLVLGLTAFQIVLGILTLLNQVPTALAAAHQATAVALFSVALWHTYELSSGHRMSAIGR